jgi:hypothetical protein
MKNNSIDQLLVLNGQYNSLLGEMADSGNRDKIRELFLTIKNITSLWNDITKIYHCPDKNIIRGFCSYRWLTRWAEEMSLFFKETNHDYCSDEEFCLQSMIELINDRAREMGRKKYEEAQIERRATIMFMDKVDDFRKQNKTLLDRIVDRITGERD